jgi:hypothetical protein
MSSVGERDAEILALFLESQVACQLLHRINSESDRQDI